MAKKKELTRGQRKAYVKEVLRSLGKTADQIARALGRARVKGDCGSVDTCPIANYVGKKVKYAEAVEVTNRVEVYYLINDGNDTESVIVPNTKAIEKFIAAFDAGNYPKLVA